jgi:hypothetical protein
LFKLYDSFLAAIHAGEIIRDTIRQRAQHKDHIKRLEAERTHRLQIIQGKYSHPRFNQG